MLVLIDESGCPGFKLTKGSTQNFAVGMIIFKCFSEAEKVSKKITDLKNSLKIGGEFKFSKSRTQIKDRFFQDVCPFEFDVRALVVNKTHIYSPYLRTNTGSFYNYFVKMLMQYDNNALLNATIKVDGSGDREFKRALNSYLRNELGENKIKKFKLVDSKKDNLIQLADMVIGAVARSYSQNRRDNKRWFDMLRRAGRIKNIWDFK